MSDGLPVLSLFCGAGGLDLGFEQVGFQPMLAIDVSAAAVETYNTNRSLRRRVARQADLALTEPEELLRWWEESAGSGVPPIGVIGGPPCQAFSVSNTRQLVDDPRARLPLRYAEFLRAFNKQFNVAFFVFENVAGLSHRLHSASLAAFQVEFAAAGFTVMPPFYLDAVRFGVPQRRRRMFIAGFNTHRFPGIRFAVPEGELTQRTVRGAIGGLPEPLLFLRGKDPAEAGLHANHWCMQPRSKKFTTDGALVPGKLAGRSFRRLLWDSPSWAVAYGHREVHVHPDGKRRLSVYEAMLLQGFPRDGYELQGTLSQQIQLVSDAVPPPVGLALGKQIRAAIESYPDCVAADAHISANGHAPQLGWWGVQTAAPRSTSA